LSSPLKVGDCSGFSALSSKSANSSRVARTDSSIVETSILVGLVWFFLEKYGIFSTWSINSITLANFQVMGRMAWILS